jgi:hypothetical protein
MTRPVCSLRGVQLYLRNVNPARVRIWVISAVTAPNKHKSCKKCSSRTDSSVTATMIANFCFVKLKHGEKYMKPSELRVVWL